LATGNWHMTLIIAVSSENDRGLLVDD